jgi:hypothetical protein
MGMIGAYMRGGTSWVPLSEGSLPGLLIRQDQRCTLAYLPRVMSEEENKFYGIDSGWWTN